MKPSKLFSLLIIVFISGSILAGCSRPQRVDDSGLETNTSEVITTPTEPTQEALDTSLAFTATQSGITAYDLLNNSADVEATDYGDAGIFVTSINGLKADDSAYWAFYVNGQYSTTGISQTELEAGDEIEFMLEKVDEASF